MKRIALAAAAACLPVLTLAAETAPQVTDAYVLSAKPTVGAAFMTIHNPGSAECLLTAVRSDAADKVELHTHKEEAGVMKMMAVEGGLAIPAGGDHALKRGGDHVMLMGLKAPLKDGDHVALTLDFGACGTAAVDAVVDNARKDDTAAMPAHMHHAAPAPADAPKTN